jgi:hypothetical protein
MAQSGRILIAPNLDYVADGAELPTFTVWAEVWGCEAKLQWLIILVSLV